MHADDTIAAIATPPGPGGIGIVRVSGPRSADIATQVFHRRTEAPEWESHRLYTGMMVDAGGHLLDRGLAVLMRRPRSFTGEDVLELHCHGSPMVLRQVLRSTLACGARLAEPGEFSKRAFLNGRIDLAQAEAIIDLVRARTASGVALAAQQLSGQLSSYLGALRSDVIRLQALLEVQIDFSEEDVQIDARESQRLADRCIETLHQLLASYEHGKIVREGTRVVIVGKPNVGKSSLLNALLGEDRAIVSPVAGTTRDTIEENSEVFGIPIVITDTAGLREARAADAVEMMGMERTSKTMAAAALLLAVYDTSAPLDAADMAVADAIGGTPLIVVLNKIDLPGAWGSDESATITNSQPVVRVSAKELQGLDELRRVIAATLDALPLAEAGTPVVTAERHRDALAKAVRSLELARDALVAGCPPDLIAVDVQDAADRIGEVTGVVSTEDVLDRIFRDFCIGK